MEPIYLDLVNSLIISNYLTLKDFYDYVEDLINNEKSVCFYLNSYEKNANICFTNLKAFQLWRTNEATKTEDLFNKIENNRQAKELKVIEEKSPDLKP